SDRSSGRPSVDSRDGEAEREGCVDVDGCGRPRARCDEGTRTRDAREGCRKIDGDGADREIPSGGRDGTARRSCERVRGG
ncbi:hypothetical protein BE221DRAFT_62522, partial [Ostreococcus tauri]